jgi:hypothetical protein
MGGSRRIWQSILRQANAVQVGDSAEMAQVCLAFSTLPNRVYRNITVVGGGGALGVAASDIAERFGLTIPQFSDQLAQRIDALLPKPGSSPGNPVDVANPFVPPKTLREIIRLAASDERIDLQLFAFLVHHYKNRSIATGQPLKSLVPLMELADAIQSVVTETSKPVTVILGNTKDGPDDLDVVEMIMDARKAFMERGIPVYSSLFECLRAIGHLNSYYERKDA